MKTKETAKKGLYIGAGAGVAAFAFAGLLYGSFIGGVIGLNIAGSIFGTPVEATLLSRMIIGASMVLGIAISGALFVTVPSILGWVAGAAVDTAKAGRAVGAEATARN